MTHKELNVFFEDQFNEHLQVALKTKNEIFKSFENSVNMCVKAIKNKKKSSFLVMEAVPLMLNILQLSSLLDFQKIEQHFLQLRLQQTHLP